MKHFFTFSSRLTYIFIFLQKNTTLKRLYLSRNLFEEKAAFHFKEALSHNETLELLDISWNHFRTHGAVAIAEGVQVGVRFNHCQKGGVKT